MRSQRVDDCQSDQIRGAGKKKRDRIAMRVLQEVCNNFCDQHSANRSRHAANADDRGDHGPGKHIGRQGEQIAGKSLMRRGGNSYHQYRNPHGRYFGDEDYRYNADGTNQHGKFAACIHSSAMAYERRREPSTGDAARVCN